MRARTTSLGKHTVVVVSDIPRNNLSCCIHRNVCIAVLGNFSTRGSLLLIVVETKFIFCDLFHAQVHLQCSLGRRKSAFKLRGTRTEPGKRQLTTHICLSQNQEDMREAPLLPPSVRMRQIYLFIYSGEALFLWLARQWKVS